MKVWIVSKNDRCIALFELFDKLTYSSMCIDVFDLLSDEIIMVMDIWRLLQPLLDKRII